MGDLDHRAKGRGAVCRTQHPSGYGGISPHSADRPFLLSIVFQKPVFYPHTWAQFVSRNEVWFSWRYLKRSHLHCDKHGRTSFLLTNVEQESFRKYAFSVLRPNLAPVYGRGHQREPPRVAPVQGTMAVSRTMVECVGSFSPLTQLLGLCAWDSNELIWAWLSFPGC